MGRLAGQFSAPERNQRPLKVPHKHRSGGPWGGESWLHRHPFCFEPGFENFARSGETQDVEFAFWRRRVGGGSGAADRSAASAGTRADVEGRQDFEEPLASSRRKSSSNHVERD